MYSKKQTLWKKIITSASYKGEAVGYLSAYGFKSVRNILNESLCPLYIRYYCLLNMHRKYIHFAACASRTFGNQCSSICHCINQLCNLINGTCPAGGCQLGYKGNSCSTGTNLLFAVLKD